MYSCTGFLTYDHFKLSFELVTPTAEAKVDVYASGIRTNRPGVHKMQLIDELFYFLFNGSFVYLNWNLPSLLVYMFLALL